jgi:hypothetical protein
LSDVGGGLDMKEEAKRKNQKGLFKSNIKRAQEANPAERSALLSTACASLFVEKQCRDAWETADVLPSERIRYQMKECRAAYCPLLPEPKPRLCAAQLGARRASPAEERERSAMWAELLQRIRVFDLGEEASFPLDAPGAGLPATPPPSPKAAVFGTRRGDWRTPVLMLSRRELVLRWRPPGDKGPDEVGLVVPRREVDSQLTSTSTEPPWDCGRLNAALLAEVVARWPDAASRPDASEEILLSADPSMRYAEIVDLMDCVRKARATAGHETHAGRTLYPAVIFSPSP